MAKKKQEDVPAGSPAWMSTFSDLMNLLLCFFVMLFSMSTMDEAKLREVVASMNTSFSIFSAGATSIGDGMLVSNGVSQLNELSEYMNSTGKLSNSLNQEQELEEDEVPEEIDQMRDIIEQQQLEENEELAENVQESVNENSLSDEITVTFNAQYVQLSMRGALLFDSGKAQLKDDAKNVLSKVAMMLERYAKNVIEIEGHTDNVPIKNAQFADNEELSSARAREVFYYLVENTNLDPALFRHAGMGDRVPIADNSTAEGRSKNRRVEIRIYNSNSQ